MANKLEWLAAEIVERLQQYGAVFPIVAVAGRTDMLPIVQKLIDCEAADMHLSGEEDIKCIITPESQHTLLYLTRISETEGAGALERMRQSVNFLANIDPHTGMLTVHKGNPMFQHLPVPGHTIARKFLYLQELGVAYGVINKCGNTFIGKALTGLDSEEAIQARYGSMEHMREIFSRTSDVFKFTVVRNPYSRLVSVYLDIICGHLPEPAQRAVLYRRALGLPVKGTIPFESMVDQIETQGFIWGPGHEHWIPQVVVSCMGSVKYDEVGRLEDLPNFLSTKIEPVLRSRGETRQGIFTGHPDRVSGASSSWMQFYPDNVIRKRVYNLYEIDFDVLRYPCWFPSA